MGWDEQAHTKNLPRYVQRKQQKLTQEQAQEILDTDITTRSIDLAKAYDVSVRTINDIRSRRSWTKLRRTN